MTDNHISQKELSERWGINIRTLERWRTKGIGPAFLKLGSRVLYRQGDVDAYEKRCLRNSTSQQANVIHRKECAV